MKNRIQTLFIFFAVLVLAGLACSTIQPSLDPKPEPTAFDEDPPVVADLEYGASRQEPYPPGKLVPAFTISVEVNDWVRGIEAWEMLSQINSGIDKLPEGWEYVCVRMTVVNDLPGLSRDISRYGFYLTGDRHVRYPVEGIVTPKPEMGGELVYGGQFSGWNCYLVPREEENLMVVVDLSGFTRSDGEFPTYIGLTEEASVSPAAVADFEVTGTGLYDDDPAQLGKMVSAFFWEVRVLDLIRGEEAYERIIEANMFNSKPPDGMEYVMAYVEAAYYGGGDEMGEIGGFDFESFGERGERYNTPSVVDPQPALDNELYPGGRVSGWVVVLAGIGEDGMTMVYQPRGEYEDEAVRYLSLEK